MFIEEMYPEQDLSCGTTLWGAELVSGSWVSDTVADALTWASLTLGAGTWEPSGEKQGNIADQQQEWVWATASPRVHVCRKGPPLSRPVIPGPGSFPCRSRPCSWVPCAGYTLYREGYTANLRRPDGWWKGKPPASS